MFSPCVRVRPVDSPYAREKRKEAGGKGPAGQKGAQLSELDLLVGDVLYFNHRVRWNVMKNVPDYSTYGYRVYLCGRCCD